MQVPFSTPATRHRRSPANPSRTARMIGTPPATAASNSKCRRCFAATSSSSAPASAITCLFAVTTDFPASSACRIQVEAGSVPPMSSTTMSASEASTSAKSEVQTAPSGVQAADARFRSTSRLQTWVSRSGRPSPLPRILATDRPTVPNPTSATFNTASIPKKIAISRLADDGH